MGRHGVHDDGTRISGFTARNINTDTVKRRNLLAQKRAVFVFVSPRLHFLVFMVAFHPSRGRFQGRLNVFGQTLKRRLQIVLRQD